MAVTSNGTARFTSFAGGAFQLLAWRRINHNPHALGRFNAAQGESKR
jgi:hypothetical protein